MSEIRLEWQRNGCDLCCVDINEQRERISSPNNVFFCRKNSRCVLFFRNITQEKVMVWSLHESLEFLSLKLETTHLYWPKARKKKRVGEHLTGSNSH